MIDPPPFQHFFEHFQQPIIRLRSGRKHSKISDCIQMEHAIDCATAPIFPRGPTDTVRSTIAAVLVQSKPRPPPAKAPSACRSGSIRIEASVGPRGAFRGRVLTAHRAAHRSQGPRPRAAARRCRVRLAICHQCARCHPEVIFFCVVPAGRPVPVSSWRFLLDV